MLSLRQIWKTPEVRKSLLYVFFMLVLFRIIAHIPVPGVNIGALSTLLQGNQLLGLLNIFSGGTLENFSVVALGVAPYITSSIIFQLLGMIVPKVEEMQKEEQGRARINRWTRWLTVPLAGMQAYSLLLLFGQQNNGSVFTVESLPVTIVAILSMTVGTIFLMWLGELVSEKHVGNGISILIFAGILSGLPQQLFQLISLYDKSQLLIVVAGFALLFAVIASIVVMNEAVRNIPVQYARQVQGARLSGAVRSHIPLKLNMGGVIPIIFAISILLFPQVLSQLFLNARTPWLASAAQWTYQVMQNQWVYGIFYFALVFSFTFFYASVIFRPEQVAENLQKQGGFVPGVRPGVATAEYLWKVTTRLLLIGALYLSAIAVLPLVMKYITGNASLVVGGTSIIIVVSVIIESMKQIDAQLTMHQYDA